MREKKNTVKIIPLVQGGPLLIISRVIVITPINGLING